MISSAASKFKALCFRKYRFRGIEHTASASHLTKVVSTCCRRHVTVYCQNTPGPSQTLTSPVSKICRRCPFFVILAGALSTCAVTILFSFLFPKTTRCQQSDSYIPRVRMAYRLVPWVDKAKHQVLPNETVLRGMGWQELAQQYHRYVENIQVICPQMLRLGNVNDGGWEICDDVQYRPHPPCLVYSFGINNDFSFDDEVASTYGCEVHSFDPSMKSRDHQRSVPVTFHATGLADYDGFWGTWRMRKLSSIRKELGHHMSELSIVKMDIEEWEWASLLAALHSGSLDDVSQLVVELHLTIKPQPPRSRYLEALLVLRQIYLAGFRIFYTTRNLHCSFRQIFDGRVKVGCHEVNMIRVESGTGRETMDLNTE